MFSGIVEQVGKVIKLEDHGDYHLIIRSSFLKKKLKLGSSVCCNGVCLTVHTIKQNKNNLNLSFDVSKETMDCTNFKN